MKKYFAIRNHKIICEIPNEEILSVMVDQELKEYCDEKGFDSWIELDEHGFLTIGGLR